MTDKHYSVLNGITKRLQDTCETADGAPVYVDVVATIAPGSVSTDASTTISTGGTAQALFAASTNHVEVR